MAQPAEVMIEPASTPTLAMKVTVDITDDANPKWSSSSFPIKGWPSEMFGSDVLVRYKDMTATAVIYTASGNPPTGSLHGKTAFKAG
jgi:hypothetical protein